MKLSCVPPDSPAGPGHLPRSDPTPGSSDAAVNQTHWARQASGTFDLLILHMGFHWVWRVWICEPKSASYYEVLVCHVFITCSHHSGTAVSNSFAGDCSLHSFVFSLLLLSKPLLMCAFNWFRLSCPLVQFTLPTIHIVSYFQHERGSMKMKARGIPPSAKVHSLTHEWKSHESAKQIPKQRPILSYTSKGHFLNTFSIIGRHLLIIVKVHCRFLKGSLIKSTVNAQKVAFNALHIVLCELPTHCI